jgi:hypothetical protein
MRLSGMSSAKVSFSFINNSNLMLFGLSLASPNIMMHAFKVFYYIYTIQFFRFAVEVFNATNYK